MQVPSLGDDVDMAMSYEAKEPFISAVQKYSASRVDGPELLVFIGNYALKVYFDDDQLTQRNSSKAPWN